MDWFRLYGEFATDPKVQSMPEVMQRRLVMVMCLRCSNVLATLHDDEIAFALRVTDADLAETKALFMRKGFIDEGWNLVNWDKRQYVSDSSTERSRRHRERKKGGVQQPCNVAATPPDTEADTEAEQNRGTTSAPSAKVALDAEGNWTGIPSAQRSAWEKAYPALSLDAELSKAAAWVIANPKNKKSNYARFLTNWLSRSQDSAPTVAKSINGASRHGNFGAQDYRAGVAADGSF
jgi:hypothetical protein